MDDVLRRLGGPPGQLSFKAKTMVASSSLRTMGVMFELVSERSPELQAEVRDWDEGRVVGMGVLPDGPSISLKVEGGRIRFLGPGLRRPAISILFKNIDAAVMMFTGQLPAYMGSVEHRVILHGNVVHAMETVRAMNIVQKFLMPVAMLNRSAKRPVHLSPEETRIKIGVLLSLLPRLLASLGR